MVYPHLPGPEADHVVVVWRLIKTLPRHDVVVIEKGSKQGRRISDWQLFLGAAQTTEVGVSTPKFADSLLQNRQSARTFLLPDLENIPFES